MNVNLINDNIDCFNHWRLGGALLCRTEVDGPYHPVNQSHWDFACAIVFIIDDEYVEFRKALSEGKTVQYKGLSSQAYRDVEVTDGNAFSLHVSNYRIKPDEPKLKVGDWITWTGKQPTQVTRIDCSNVICEYGSLCGGLNSVSRLWQPKPGEMCVFWDDESRYTIAPFDKFGAGGMPYSNGVTSYYNNVAPVVFDLNIYKG